MLRPDSQPSVPALRRSDGSCATDKKARAELLASQSKWLLPGNCSDLLDIHRPSAEVDDFTLIRMRHARNELRNLSEHSATSPDDLPCIILRTCCDELAVPFTLLARQIIAWAGGLGRGVSTGCAQSTRRRAVLSQGITEASS